MPRTYTLTVQSVLSSARFLIADKRSDMGLRNTDAELIACLNDALNAMVGVLPGLFTSIAPFPCVAGYLQVLESTRAVIFLGVVGVPQGDAMTLAQFSPSWMTATTQGEIAEYMAVEGDPLRFMVYPPSVAGQAVVVRMVVSPEPLVAVTDKVPVPENYAPALAEYVAGRTDMQEDEAAVSGRASQLMDRFLSSVKVLSTA